MEAQYLRPTLISNTRSKTATPPHEISHSLPVRPSPKKDRDAVTYTSIEQDLQAGIETQDDNDTISCGDVADLYSLSSYNPEDLDT